MLIDLLLKFLALLGSRIEEYPVAEGQGSVCRALRLPWVVAEVGLYVVRTKSVTAYSPICIPGLVRRVKEPSPGFGLLALGALNPVDSRAALGWECIGGVFSTDH